MVNRAVLDARLERLRTYLSVLDKTLEYDIERFCADPFIYSTAERNLHLAIECLLDIGNHIIADSGHPKPESYADIFRTLKDQGVVSAALFSEIDGMAAFRNLLVHDYVKIDHHQVYRILNSKLPGLKMLASVYAELI
ncbi:MAG: DUF86 domain-containing protein [Desulfuromonas sp.]